MAGSFTVCVHGGIVTFANSASSIFSMHYTSFISVRHTLHLYYYHMQFQYKSAIQFVQKYKNLYAKFEAYLRGNEGLIAILYLLLSRKARQVIMMCCRFAWVCMYVYRTSLHEFSSKATMDLM